MRALRWLLVCILSGSMWGFVIAVALGSVGTALRFVVSGTAAVVILIAIEWLGTEVNAGRREGARHG